MSFLASIYLIPAVFALRVHFCCLVVQFCWVWLNFQEQHTVFSHDVTAAMLSKNTETAATLLSQNNPVGVKLFSSNKFAWVLATWVKTLYLIHTSLLFNTLFLTSISSDSRFLNIFTHKIHPDDGELKFVSTSFLNKSRVNQAPINPCVNISCFCFSVSSYWRWEKWYFANATFCKLWQHWARVFGRFSLSLNPILGAFALRFAAWLKTESSQGLNWLHLGFASLAFEQHNPVNPYN